MFDFVATAWAGLVVGVPLIYVTWNALRQRQYSLLLATIIGLLVLWFFPGQTLLVIWLVLLLLMGICLTIFVFYTCLAVHLMLFPGRRQVWPEAGVSPRIAVLIPARNEARVVLGCLDSVLRSDYPADLFDVIVIDDGSVDGTAQLVSSYADAHPCVHLITRSPMAERGKAAALNEAIAQVDAEFVCILDADHHVVENFFSKTLPHFRDPKIGGVQARKIGRNRSENLLTRLIELELQGWQYCFLESKSQSHLIPVSFGAGCIFRTELFRRLGSFNNDLATEDLEFSLRMYKAGYKIHFEPGTYTTDELVSNWKSFFNQRYRWARGTTQAIPLHWRSSYQAERRTLREKLDFCFYTVLLGMMIIPYFQIASHALAVVARVDLPLAFVVPSSYAFVIVLCYVTAGLRNLGESVEQGPRGLLNLFSLTIGMCFYYASLFLITNLKAFLDEFVIRIPYRPVKAEHLGTGSKRQRKKSARPESRTMSLEERLVLTCGRYASNPEQIFALRSKLHELDWKRVEDLARFHGVAGLVHANLVRYGLEPNIPSSVRDSLLAFRRLVLARNLYLQQAWREIAKAFADADLEVIPLKGIRMVDQSYPLDVRPMHDIDLLVKLSRVKEASQRLEALGYRPAPHPNLNAKAWWTQRPYRHPSTQVVVDLHWDLINIYSYRQVYPIPVEDVWARAHPVGPNNIEYQMASEDLLIHSALHAAMHHHFSNLSQLVDLGEILRTSDQTLAWEQVVQLASAYRIKSPVYSALLLSRDLTGTLVPDIAMQALKPPLHRRICFWLYFPGLRRTFDSRTPSRLSRDLKWFWGSVVMTDSLWDSLRAIRGNVNFVLRETAEILLDANRRAMLRRSLGR